MQSTMQSGLTFCFLLSVAVLPAAAQSDRFGGPVEFRSPDRPISVPTLRFPEAAGLSSDKLSSTSGMSAPENALKQLDMELGRTLSRSEPGRRGPPDKTDDQREERAQAKGTFK
ncbi:MAG: exported protein of unknown function [Nitrospira sp.]|nr:exported protein of unknown function [Nitrospira sp.]